MGFSVLNVVTGSLALIATIAEGQQHWKHGPSFGWRQRSTKGYIVSAETTLIAGPPPNPAVPRLALWPGMDTKGSTLIQPIIVSTKSSEYPDCGLGSGGKWCVFASYLQISQRMGKKFAITGEEPLKMAFRYNETIDGYEQDVSINGRIRSSLPFKGSGKTKSFYTDVECQGAHAGVVTAHKYIDTKIVLSEPDPAWGPRPSNHFMACADKITTPDGGRTWIIPTINIKQSNAPQDYAAGNKLGKEILC